MKSALFVDLRAGYSPQTLQRDLLSGLLVGIVAIPLNVAFAIGSGLGPERGLWTGMISAFVLTFLGGSSHQISGPTGAFMGMIYAIVQKHGVEGLIEATALAGLILATLGLLRLGRIFQYIPFAVVIGFTGGIAVIIFSSQVNELLGLGLSDLPPDLFGKWMEYARHLGRANPWAILVALITIVGIVGLNRLDRRIPAALLLILLTTALVHLFQLPVSTIGDRFGVMQAVSAAPMLPRWDPSTLTNLALPALSIALLGGIESLLSALVAERMTSKQHDPNMELFGLGIANLVSGLWGGMPITGAIARTATNIRAGGLTPMANLFHGLVLVSTLMFMGQYVALIPMAALAGVLTTVAWGMSEQETFRELLRGPRGDLLALLATFFLTLSVDLVVAIPVGIVASLVVFVRKMSENHRFAIHRGEFQDMPSEIDPMGRTKVAIPHQAVVVEFVGPLFFGTIQSFTAYLKELEASEHRITLIRLREVPSIDAGGLKLLENFVAREKKHKRHVLLCAVQPGVLRALQRIGLDREIGPENIVPNVITGLSIAERLLGGPITDLVSRLRNGGQPLWLAVGTKEEAIKAAFEAMDLPEDEKRRLLDACLAREKAGSTLFPGGLMMPDPRDQVLDPDFPERIVLCYLEPPLIEEQEIISVMAILLSHTVDSHLKSFAEWMVLYRRAEFRDLLLSRPPLSDLLAYLEKQNWVASRNLAAPPP